MERIDSVWSDASEFVDDMKEKDVIDRSKDRVPVSYESAIENLRDALKLSFYEEWKASRK